MQSTADQLYIGSTGSHLTTAIATQYLYAMGTLFAPGAHDVTLQWTVDGAPIAGATDRIFVVTRELMGKTVNVVASYTDATGAAQDVTSPPVAVDTMTIEENAVEWAFVTFLGRPATPHDVAYWSGQLEKDYIPQMAALVQAMLVSPEGAERYSLLDPGATVDTMFQTVFARPPTHAERQEYVDKLNGGSWTFIEVIEAIAFPTNNADREMASLKVDAAKAFTLALDTPVEQAAYGATSAYALGAALLASVTDPVSRDSAIASVDHAVAAVLALPANHAAQGAVRIDGTPGVGDVLTVSNTLTDADGVGAVHYQWCVDGVPIAGATGATLALDQAMYGKSISVMARYGDGLGNVEGMPGAATAPVHMSHDALAVERTFIAYLGRPAGEADVAHWAAALDADPDAIAALRDSLAALPEFKAAYAGLDNAHAIERAYVTQFGHGPSDAERAYWTATLAGGGATVAQMLHSISEAAVGADADVLANKVAAADAFTGAADAGHYDQATWYATPAAHRIGSDYLAAVTDAASLATAVAHVGATVDGLLQTPPASPPTGFVSVEADDGLGMVVGSTLKGWNSLQDADGMGPVTYRWLADGVAIAGADGDSLVLSNALIGKEISVVASYVDGYGIPAAISSNATERVQPAGVRALVERTFVEYLGRPADPAGLAYWSQIVSAPAAGVGALRAALVESAEFANAFAGLSAHDAVEKIALRLLGTTEYEGDTALHAAELAAGRETLADIVRTYAAIDIELHGSTMNDKTGAAYLFTAALDTQAELAAYTNSAAYGRAGHLLDGITDSASVPAALAALDATIAAIVALPPDHAASANVTIEGSLSAGNTLTARANVTDADGVVSLRYQWKQDGVDLVGANGATYVVQPGQASHSITVAVVETDALGYVTSAISPAAGASDDRLMGTGSSTMAGGAGNDVYVVMGPRDIVVEKANEGVDRIEVAFGSGAYTLPDNVENGTITAATGNVALTGNALANVLIGNAGANTLTGNGGDDTLDGGAGADKLIGGAGNDVYLVDNAGDVVTEAANGGIDRVETKLAAYTLTPDVENLVYKGAAAFTGTGNASDNLIAGGAAGDKLFGLGGNDTLSGYAGNDSLDGGAGNDLLDAGSGVDTVDGGAGDDTLHVLGRFADYTRTRPNATDTVLVDKLTGENIVLRNVEHIVFADGAKTLAETQINLASAGNDSLTGTDGNDTLDGGLGSDTLSGGAGNDVYVVNDAADLVVERANEGIDQVKVAFIKAGTYTLPDNVENAIVTAAATLAVNLTGNALDNLLTGNAAANILTGGAGDDTLDGGAGADKLVGGVGNDVYLVDNAADVVTETANGGVDRVETTLAAYTLTLEVENLAYKGSAAFAGTGNASNNTMDGAGGNDKLLGLAGDDTLHGNAGNDSLDGGAGNDLLDAGTGSDTVDGGAGDDTLQVLGRFADYARARPTATDTLLVDKATGESILLRNVEHVAFLDGVKTLAQLQDNTASPGNDVLTGTSANDTLDGGLGRDTMSGGQGDDLYLVNDAGDVVVEQANGGTDQVNVGLAAVGTYTLPDNVENAKVTGTLALGLTGNALANVLTGNAAANTLNGGDGDDTLDGGAGADKLIGGAGNDVYLVDNAADAVTEAAGGGSDRVDTVLAAYTLGANVENLVYKGAAAFTGSGNALDNAIGGGAGADKLFGLAGDDILQGYAGNDSLDGGAGNDLLDAGTGSDTVDGGLGDDTLQVLGRFADYVRSRPTATDTVLVDKATGESILLRNVEHIAFADGVKTLVEVQANTASAGNDVLTGTSGNDTLDGGLGSDTLSGGQGDDTYVVNDAADVVIEQPGAGTDRVNVAFVKAGAYTLPDNVENATITAAATLAVNLTGNALANNLVGNGAANALNGGAGDDTLDGGAGADTLDGGAGMNTLSGGDGKDVFVLATAGADNRVLDFHSATDKLRIGQAALHIGDGDALVEGAAARAGAGGFAASAELVVFTAKIAGALTTASAAAAIGSATHAYALGASALFVVNNGHDSALYRFESHDADALVTSGELTELAVLVGTPTLALADIAFAS